jgi:hypothetical protein
MRRCRAHVLIGRLLAEGLVLAGFPALAATPAFTIAATNVTMSSSTSSGQGSSSFTLTSINGYVGLVGINCSAPTPPMGVLVPICDFGGPAYPQIESACRGIAGIMGCRRTWPWRLRSCSALDSGAARRAGSRWLCSPLAYSPV